MQVLGVHIDSPFLRFALVQKTRQGIELFALKSATFPDSDSVKQLYKGSFSGPIISGLAASELLIRPIEIQKGTRRHFEEIVAFQSASTMHLNPTEVLSVPLLLNQGTEALLFTASKEGLRHHLGELERWQIDPSRVTAVPLALIQYALWKTPTLQEAFLIHLGSSEWTCVWMEKKGLKKAHAIAGGIEMLLSALWEDRRKTLFKKEMEGFAKQIDLLQLQGELNPHFAGLLKKMRQELAKVIYSFHRAGGGKPVLFTGRVDPFIHLREYLLEGLKDYIVEGDKQGPGLEETKYAIPIGLTLEHRSQALQLRREEFFPKENWQKAGLFSLCLFLLAIGLSLGLACLGHWMVQQRKSERIASIQIALDRWDPSLKEHCLSQAPILEQLRQAIASHPKEYPYISQAPKVAEVLTWLDTHPLFQSMKKEQEPIEILSLHYHLLQFPTVESPQEPYVAQVEMEFNMASPLYMRKFHEALLQGDALVDPGREVHWEALEDRCRISFYLKNRSPHVP